MPTDDYNVQPGLKVVLGIFEASLILPGIIFANNTRKSNVGGNSVVSTFLD